MKMSFRERMLLAFAFVAAIFLIYLLRGKYGDIHQLVTDNKKAAETQRKTQEALMELRKPREAAQDVEQLRKQVNNLREVQQERQREQQMIDLLKQRKAAPNMFAPTPLDGHKELAPLKEMQQALVQERQKIGAFQTSWHLIGNPAPEALSESMELRQLGVQLSNLANESHVRIRENGPHTLGNPTHPAVDPSRPALDLVLLYKTYPRPIYRLTLESSYEGISRFIQGLKHLPRRRVTIIQFDLEVMKPTADGDARGPRIKRPIRDHEPPMLKTTLVLGM